MHSVPKNTLITIYDAVHEMAHFADPHLLKDAQAVGETLGKNGLGGVTRSGSPLATAALLALHEAGGAAIMLSPAGSELEHVRSFRLPRASMPTVYTGRGALGADVMALTSGRAVVIIGSDEEALYGILGCADGHDLPIAIFTNAPEPQVRDMIGKRYPQILPHLFVSSQPVAVGKHIAEELRKRHVASKI